VLPAAGCNSAPANAPEKKAPEVVVTTPISDEVADYEDFTGRLDGLFSIDIRARASGFVVSAPFKEGDMVHEGDLLFLIDQQPYKADLNLAEANLRLAEADQNLMQKNAVRARTLVKTNAMAVEDFDTAQAMWEKSQATVAAMGATRDRAKLNLEYTRVIAPMSGRVSRRLVDPGNLVNQDQTILTTLVTDKQLYAYFDVDERTYLNLGIPTTPGADSAADKLRFPVLLELANEDQFARTGVVNFVDNRVNANTGTIRMRAVFDNAEGTLRAGLFVRIRVPIGTRYRAALIPDEAVLSDQGRKYVYIVDDKGVVAYRKVTLGQEIKGLRVIRDTGVKGEGIAMGEKVIISGMQRVRPGVTVHAEVQAPPRPPESPLGKLLSGARQQPAPQQDQPEKKASTPVTAPTPAAAKPKEAAAAKRDSAPAHP
jgi:RND family efflux transporter MFP subunit